MSANSEELVLKTAAGDEVSLDKELVAIWTNAIMTSVPKAEPEAVPDESAAKKRTASEEPKGEEPPIKKKAIDPPSVPAESEEDVEMTDIEDLIEGWSDNDSF